MDAFRALYKDGGIPRFYRGTLLTLPAISLVDATRRRVGLIPALMQGPLSRFGDTAANTGTLALLDTFESTKDLPVGAKTVAASASAAGFRIFLMPSKLH